MSSLFSVSDDIESLGRNMSKIKVHSDKLHRMELLRLFPLGEFESLNFDEDGFTMLPDPSHPFFAAAKEYLATSMYAVFVPNMLSSF